MYEPQGFVDPTFISGNMEGLGTLLSRVIASWATRPLAKFCNSALESQVSLLVSTS